MRRVIEREPHAFKGDQAVGELVLDGLEFSDRLPELVALLGVVDDELESAPRRAVRARRERKLGFEQQIVQRGRFQLNDGRWRRVQSNSKSPQAPMARVGSRSTPDTPNSTTASAAFPTVTRRCVQLAGDFDEPKYAARAFVRNSDRACIGSGSSATEGKRHARLTGMHFFEQVDGGFGAAARQRRDWRARPTTSARGTRRGQVRPSPPISRGGRLR